MVQVAQAQTSDLVPLGDKLGDVGQYYSSSAASFGSVTYIQNTSSSSVTFKVEVYDDDGGSVFWTITGCTLNGNERATLQMNTSTGKLIKHSTSGSQSNCGSGNTKSNIHGIYHLKITKTGGMEHHRHRQVLGRISSPICHQQHMVRPLRPGASS